MEQVTVAEALKLGLKVGDKITISIDVEIVHSKAILDEKYPICVKNEHLGFRIWIEGTEKITYTPQSYIPKHRELCAVVTTTGLTTECEVFESNGRLFAISLIGGKPDGVFCPEQIERFLPLTK